MLKRTLTITLSAIGVTAGVIILLIVYSFSAPFWFNPAKSLSHVAVDFAKENNFEQFVEYNGAATGLDNTIPFYVRIYQGAMTTTEAKDKLAKSLAQTGYKNKEIFYTYDKACPYGTSSPDCPETELKGFTTNNDKPYWLIVGKNAVGDNVRAEISDQTYYNWANTLDHGEHPNPTNKTVIVIGFTSHKKL